jgi:putative nucleotidyltransferase with HDIG domain
LSDLKISYKIPINIKSNGDSAERILTPYKGYHDHYPPKRHSSAEKGYMDVKGFIKGLKDLPTIPALLGKIISVVSDEDSSTQDLYKLISHDQALAERVLRVANSTFFGHSGEVKDIRQAIMFLGYNKIKSMAVGMTVMDAFPAHSSCNIKNLWIHGYEVALFAEALSEVICMTCPRECFLSGLLHDIGRIIFYKMNPRGFLEIEATNGKLEKEKELFGCTHAEAGAWFAMENGLPPEIISAIQFHHQPSHSTLYKDSVSIVSLAEALSGMFSPKRENDGIWKEEHEVLFLEYSLTDDDIMFVGERFCAAKPEIEQFFNSP